VYLLLSFDDTLIIFLLLSGIERLLLANLLSLVGVVVRSISGKSTSLLERKEEKQW